MDEINDLKSSLVYDRNAIQTLLAKTALDASRLKQAEEELNHLKYANLDYSQVPWAELLNVDAGGNTNKELKHHINNMMEGKMGIQCSSYNVHTLQTAPQIYINYPDVSTHYKELLVRVLDILAKNLKPTETRARFNKEPQLGQMISILDPSCGEYGSKHAFHKDGTWYIIYNRTMEAGFPTYPTTQALVDYLCEYLSHNKEDQE